MAGQPNRCERIAFGHLEPGLQTGFCESTGGGWSTAFVAHDSQLVRVPDDLSRRGGGHRRADRVRSARRAIGRCQATSRSSVPARSACSRSPRFASSASTTRSSRTAKHPQQQQLADSSVRTVVVATSELPRVVRSLTGAMVIGEQLTARHHDASSTASAVPSRCSRRSPSSLPAVTSCSSACPGRAPRSTSRGSGTARSSLRGCYAYTRDDFDTAIDARPRPAARPARDAPPIPSPATATPSSTPPTPAPVAR